MALESELEEDLGILRDKLESKNKVVSDLREELKLLKHENICSSEQISNLKGLLHLSEEKTKNLSESLEAEKTVKESYRTKLDDRSKQLEVSKLEFEKTIRSLENEKAVLTAAVEARDRKLDIFKELKHEVESLKQKLQEKEKECNKLMDLSKTNHHLKDQLNDSSTFQKALEDKLKQMDLERQTALNELQKERDLSTQTKVELDKLKTLLQTMKGERNNFKQKADSLAKEISRLRKSDVEARNYERSQEDYKKLQEEVTSLRSERRAIKDELEATQIAHAAYIQAQQQAGEDTDLIRSLNKCAELERVISDMTEYLHAKEMQLETMQEILRQTKSNNDA
jgi:chromosome segregation ATPase